MSLRGVYRRGDTTAFASNTRYVLENAPCRVILGFAPKSIPTQAEPAASEVTPDSLVLTRARRFGPSQDASGSCSKPAQEPPPFARHLRPAKLGEPRHKLVPGHHRQAARF